MKHNEFERLGHDVNIIINGILDYLPSSPLAILLCGSYGRDEGAWYYDNGILMPYNDYDFAVVVDFTFDNSKIDSLRKELAKEVGVSWVDIDFYSKEYLKKIRPSIKNYDLLHASKCIYGSLDSITIADFKSSDIEFDDIDTLYRTRIWTFLGSWDGSFHDLSESEARYFKNQMAKALLATVDMRLISYKEYTPLYHDRVEKVVSIESDNRKYVEAIKWALDEKLRPSSGSMSKEDMICLYESTRQFFYESMKVAAKKKSCYYLSPQKTYRYYCFRSLHLLHVLYHIVVYNSMKPQKRLDVFLAQNYVLAAYGDNENGIDYINRANKLLKRWKYTNEYVTDWNQIRGIVAKARNDI